MPLGYTSLWVFRHIAEGSGSAPWAARAEVCRMKEHCNLAMGTRGPAHRCTRQPTGTIARAAASAIAAALALCVGLAGMPMGRPSLGASPAAPQAAAQPQKEPAQAGATAAEPAAAQPSPGAPPGTPELTVEAAKEEAFAVVRQLMRDFPDDTAAMSLMANVHMRLADHAEAEKWWQMCIDLNPRQANAYHGLAMIARIKGDHEKALELWRKAQDIDPNLHGVYGAFAEALMDAGRTDEAAAALEKEIKISPGSGKYHFLLGQARFQQKQYEKAAQCYQKAIELEPQSSHPYYGLATAYARLGQEDKARQHMDRFRTLRDQEEEAASRRKRGTDDRQFVTSVLAQTRVEAGIFCAARLRMKEAEGHWRRAAALEPKNRQCRQALADLCRVSGRLAEALDLCEQLRQIDPGNTATYHLDAGVLLVGLERWDAAEESFRKAMELAPTRPPVYRSLINLLLLRNQKLPEARTLARKLVELEPAAPNYRLLAKACLRNSDDAGARDALRRAMDLDGGKAGTRMEPKQPAQGK
jgi:tetratricopeptide (TPR) repeat protein